MRFEQQVTVAASPATVWDVVRDPSALGRYSERLRIDRVDGTEAPGLGARYRVMMVVGAAPVGGSIEVIAFEPERELQWTTLTGVDHRMRIRLRARPDGGTALTLRFGYDSPGIFGTLADLASVRSVRRILGDVLDRIAAEVDGHPPTAHRPSPVAWLAHEAGNAAVLARAGIIAPMRPDKLPRLGLAALAWGPTLATGVAVNAIRHPDRPMVVDEQGELTWADVDRRTDAMAVGLADLGIREGDAVGLMARNHRGFVEAAVAVAKLGADVLLLNTAFAKPQLTDVCAREAPVALLYDAEFAGLLADASPGRHLVLTHGESDDVPTLEALAARHAGQRTGKPHRHGRLTILTSGTTGTPKGAQRASVGLTLDAPAGFLDAIPMRARSTMVIAAPLFHTWGLANFALALGLGATVVLRGRFDPEATLADVAATRADVLAVVPVMLQRILDLEPGLRAAYDVDSLRVVAASGSAVSGELARRWMDAFGDNLYNTYGSTEVATATIATPADLRAAPGTAGRPPRGVTLKLLDEDGAEVLQGRVGRIFVGNAMLFEGYTGGGDKERVGGLAATGDLGRLDETGRLFIEGRDDEMIVSGGENVFPREVEDALGRHPAVVEAAAVGVDDADFGQRLRAFVVLRSPATEDELKEHVRDELARFKVPREIVVLDELPRNGTGKVLKRELPTES